MDAIEICRRVAALKVARSNVEVIWNDVEKYIMPLRIGNMYEREVSEAALNLLRLEDVYDSTAIAAAQKMTNAMHGSITNPNVKWRAREFQLSDINKDPDSKDWLEKADDREWNELYSANFDPEVSSAYGDLVGVGNSFFSTMAEKDDPEDWQGFNFKAMPIKESFFERDHRGNVFRYYHDFFWTATELKSKFPTDTMPDIVEKCFGDGGDPTTRFEVIYATYKRLGKEKNTGFDHPFAIEERPFGAKYVLVATKQHLGKEEGFYEMPITHCPWATTSGSIWGHGPGMVMAPTVKYINYWMQLEDMAVRKWIDPPTLVEERGLISDLDLAPGGVTTVRDLERSIKTFLAEGRVDFSKMSIKDMRDQVREVFHNDELQLKDSPQMSATEAQIRYELMNRVLGPTMGNIQNQLLSPILDRTFKTLLRNKQFGDAPPLVKAKKAQLKVVYTGALMRAQRSDEVAAIERWLGQVGAAAKVFPAVMNVVDITTWARDLAQKLGIPAKLLRSEKEVQQLVEQQQKVAAEQARAALVRADGEAKKAQGEGEQAQRGVANAA